MGNHDSYSDCGRGADYGAAAGDKAIPLTIPLLDTRTAREYVL